jgi:hypothetical protein
MPIDRAKAIAEVAQTVINSAKVEVDMMEAIGFKNVEPTGFFSQALSGPAKPALEHAPTPTPGAGLPPSGPKPRV